MKTTILAIGLCALLGCKTAARDVRQDVVSPAAEDKGPPAVPQESGKEFRWGNASITVGMTKEDVLEQIPLSGFAEWGRNWGISVPDQATIDSEKWVLRFGTSTGAAPGGGYVHLEFRDGKVIHILAVYPPYAYRTAAAEGAGVWRGVGAADWR